MLVKTTRLFRQPVARHWSFLYFIRPAASFPVPQSDTEASLCSFCRTRWLLWGNSRCRPYSGCSFCPRPVCCFPAGCCSAGTAPRTYRSRCRHPLPGRLLLLQRTIEHRVHRTAHKAVVEVLSRRGKFLPGFELGQHLLKRGLCLQALASLRKPVLFCSCTFSGKLLYL